MMGEVRVRAQPAVGAAEVTRHRREHGRFSPADAEMRDRVEIRRDQLRMDLRRALRAVSIGGCQRARHRLERERLDVQRAGPPQPGPATGTAY